LNPKSTHRSLPVKTRTFVPEKTYRVVELAQPYWRYEEKLVGAKILFLEQIEATQDLAGFLRFKGRNPPYFTILSGPLKGQTTIGLPLCRILTVRRKDLGKCPCPAYPYPHRPGSGDCPHA
jgi:hypothetical protein